ncbi:MAG: 2-phospho-L-lactate/phosphoenolpyruvate guanylyltransferase [Frankiales bacterium]|jgi:2-phospho-L-lactate guanylyltransferase|nr:2-phospho-L-lactate/phosphoenolpyruvate guanylyltransferase [Frankiales bacterium]
MTAHENPISPANRPLSPASGTTGGATLRWSVVVPVKILRSAKSRLAALDPAAREAVALAMALDTIEAALRCDHVGSVVVVSDDSAATAFIEAGAVVVPDTPNAGLNRALEHGATEAVRRRPDDGVIALTADLPALRPEELSRVLDIAATHPRTVLADASGKGTVALTAVPGIALNPFFGPGSLEQHAQTGAVLLDVDAPGLRRDVDTIDDLRQALRIGCGPRTTAIASSILETGSAQQATVRDFDESTRSGTVLLDDGTALVFDGRAFDRGGLRLLRSGQRVRIAVAPGGTSSEPQVTAVTLATFPLPGE